jgi:cyclohexadienyl dehydratase
LVGFCVSALTELLLWCTAATAQQSCVLRIGTSGDYAPFSIAESASDVAGLDAEIARRLGADFGCAVQFVRFAWPELSSRLKSGGFDLVASGVTLRWERALVGRFSRPYASTGAVALIRGSDAGRFGTVTDINQPGVRIAVNAGGHLERVARGQFPTARVQPVPDNRALPQTLRDGSADVVLTDSAEVRAWLKDDLRTVGPFTHDHKALLLPAAAQDLAARVDTWLVAREADGWLARQRSRWLGDDAAMDAARAGREAVAGLIAVRLALMPAVAAAKRQAGLPIEDRTQERLVLMRVAGKAPVHRERVTNTYMELIRLAKAVQHAAADETRAPLDALRDAIFRIDDQLIREVDRVPPGSVAEWQQLLDKAITVVGVDSAMRARLAQALAGEPQPTR